MNDFTEILSLIEQGDPSRSEELLPLVYRELRKLAADWLANEAPGQTLQPTALVHEAYLRLVDPECTQAWSSKGHFFSAAAGSMRRILVERARLKLRDKHGGNWKRVNLEQDGITINGRSHQLLDLDEALELFHEEDPVKADLVELRYFAGMSVEEAAGVLGISRSTASRYWTYAKAWLYNAIKEDDD